MNSTQFNTRSFIALRVLIVLLCVGFSSYISAAVTSSTVIDLPGLFQSVSLTELEPAADRQDSNANHTAHHTHGAAAKHDVKFSKQQSSHHGMPCSSDCGATSPCPSICSSICAVACSAAVVNFNPHTALMNGIYPIQQWSNDRFVVGFQLPPLRRPPKV